MNYHHLTNVTKSCLHAVTAEQSVLSYRHIYYVNFIVYLRWLQIFFPLKSPDIYIYIYIYKTILSIAVWIDEQMFESHKRVTIYGRVFDYYSHLLIFIAPIPSNIMFAAFWLFSYSRIECQCLHGIIHLLLGISFQS